MGYDGSLYSILILVLSITFIAGTIPLYIALTHSVKKRVVRGEDFSAGHVFLWQTGWGFAWYFSLGIAVIIYFFVKQAEIYDTKLQYTQTIGTIKSIRDNELLMQQQNYQQPVYPSGPQPQPPNTPHFAQPGSQIPQQHPQQPTQVGSQPVQQIPEPPTQPGQQPPQPPQY